MSGRLFVQCGQCGAVLGVPRGVGTLPVTCRRCGHQFTVNTSLPASFGGTPARPLKAADMERTRRRRRPGRWLGAAALCMVILLAALLWGVPDSAAQGLLADTSTTQQTGDTDPAPPDNSPTGGDTSAGEPDTGDPDTTGGGDTAGSGAPGGVDPSSTGGDSDDSVYQRAEAVIPYFRLRYFLSAMTEEELEVACQVYESAMAFESTCDFEEGTGLDSDTFYNVLWVMNHECPELFHLDWYNDAPGADPDYSGFVAYTDNFSGLVVKCDLPYLLSETEYWNLRRSCESVIDGFVAATAGYTDQEKEKYVFDTIASNSYYSLDADNADNAYGALVSHLALCDGFSDAMKWAMEAMGIQCLKLVGSPVTDAYDDPHAWNAINLDGTYYEVDLTWSAPSDNDIDIGAPGTIYYPVYNAWSWLHNDFAVDDYFSAIAPIPERNRTDMSYYAQRGCLVAPGADPAPILERQIRALSDEGGLVYLHFVDQQQYERFFNDESAQLLTDLLSPLGKSYSWSAFGTACLYVANITFS